MFKLNGLILGAVIFMLSSTVSASVIIDNQQIPTEDIVSIVITPGTGTLIINTTIGYDVAPSNGTTPPVGSAAISSFTASPSTFVEGGSTTLSWVTQNATSCTPSDGTATWLNKNITLASGSTNIQISAPGSYAFTLVCTGADNLNATRNLVVTVTAESTPTNTSCGSPALSGTETTWLEFWGIPFPGPGYMQKEDPVPNRGYRAYKFNTGNVVDSGGLASVGVTHTSGSRLGSISECPGDFQVSSDCKHSWGIGAGITWSTNGLQNSCALQPNTDYYFNITFVNDGVTPSNATCTGFCGVKLQHFNR